MKEFDKITKAYLTNMFSRGGETEDVMAIYNALPDKSITNEEGKSLYHIAANYADYEAIDLLVQEGVKPRPDDNDNTPLHELVKVPLNFSFEKLDQMGDAIYTTAKKLLELKVNPKKKNQAGEIAYYKAGANYMYPFIQALADAGVKMDATAEEGKNLLHLICDKIYHQQSNKGAVEAAYKTIKALLDSGVDPEDKDIFDTTPLTYAQRSGIKEIAALLNGEDEASKSAGMTFEQAVLQKDIEAVEALIQSGADIDEVSESHKTPLMTACQYPSLDIVKLLIKNGADVNFKSGEDARTAVYYLFTDAIRNLHIGVVGGQKTNVIIKILQALIDGNLDINGFVDDKGNTALNLLCTIDYIDGINNSLAEELINADCDVNIPNLLGRTPLMTFAGSGDEPNHNIAELLLDNDADTTPVDKRSSTALMYAAGNRNKISAKKIVEMILDNDAATIDKINNDGQTALDIAVSSENEAVVKLLLSNM